MKRWETRLTDFPIDWLSDWLIFKRQQKESSRKKTHRRLLRVNKTGIKSYLFVDISENIYILLSSECLQKNIKSKTPLAQLFNIWKVINQFEYN